ncbi:hypothetical protein [Dyadobacter sp. 32]|uniref:hypothetical protein n=1 Tax=Dyadobacter sp. 32 TaxID=538966 RepID=UPI0039C672C5
MKTLTSFAGLFCLFILMVSCNSGAKDPVQASERLLSPTKWYISEIWVNDALTFSEGKMKPQFGGIEFDRYMESVAFKKEGIFLGYFKDDSKAMTLRWKVNQANVSVGAVDSTAKGGEWTIAPQDVLKGAFTMKTQSTAYDFPRMTKIALKYKTDQ